MVAKLVAARQANAGIDNRRQIMLATLDQVGRIILLFADYTKELHTQAKADTETIFRRLQKDICDLEMSPGAACASWLVLTPGC